MNLDAIKMLAELLSGKGFNGSAQNSEEKEYGKRDTGYRAGYARESGFGSNSAYADNGGYGGRAESMREGGFKAGYARENETSTPFIIQNRIGEQVELSGHPSDKKEEKAGSIFDMLRGKGKGDMLSTLLPMLLNMSGAKSAEASKTSKKAEANVASSDYEAGDDRRQSESAKSAPNNDTFGRAESEPYASESGVDGRFSHSGSAERRCHSGDGQADSEAFGLKDGQTNDSFPTSKREASENAHGGSKGLEEKIADALKSAGGRYTENAPHVIETKSDLRETRAATMSKDGIISGGKDGMDKFMPITFAGYAMLSAINRLYNAKSGIVR